MGGVCKNIGIAMGKRDSQIDEWNKREANFRKL